MKYRKKASTWLSHIAFT